MDWKIDFLDAGSIISVRTEGTITLEPFMRMAAELLALASVHGASRFLVDHRQATIGLSTMEIYNLARGIENLGLRKGAKAAIVFASSSEDKADFMFYEDRAQNYGFEHRVFVDRDAALAWLVGP